MDPTWSITPVERARHAEQFASICPVNGFVTGSQAKGFFMQSGLSPMILAQIWGLADMNGDGQMDLNEFSVACKLITLKLKGFEIPSVLPPALLVVPQPAPMAVVSMVGQPPMMAPVSSATGMMQTTAAPMPMPMAMQQPPPQQQMMYSNVATSVPMSQQQMMPQMNMQAAGMPPNSMAAAPGMPPMSMAAPVPMAPQQQQAAAMSPQPPRMATPVMGGHSSGSSTPTMVAAPPPTEWAIPPHTKTKYSQIFQQTDRARTGFLAGVQARNILLQSGLPQNILAQIWGLSDIDNDGKLNAEEFVLSGHLCELATKGEPIPTVLPPNLIPPSYRPGGGGGGGGIVGVVAATGQVVCAPAGSETTPSTPGSVQADSVTGADSFEDKRRENFNKGQAELERRRQSLIDQQKKEEEERKRKEKEEAEEREKQKQELERQRLAEWEKQRREELVQHRQREQEKLLALKAKQEHSAAELESLRDKVKTLTTGISDARTGVSDVKTFIDGMRSSRDAKMQQMNELKTKLKEQNQRLLEVTQEKANLEAKTKAKAAQMSEDGNQELTDFEIKKIEKEKQVVALRESFKGVEEKETSQRNQFDEIKNRLNMRRDDLEKVIESCKTIYDEFDEKRREIKAEKAKRIRELTDPDHAWGSGAPEEDGTGENNVRANEATNEDLEGDYVHYRAIYDYQSTNADDLNFVVGDVIRCHAEQTGAEPGWLGGELNGKVGWFPETYVEQVGASDGLSAAAVTTAATVVPVANAEVNAIEPVTARALYDYSHDTFSFSRGESIFVIDQSNSDWWYGFKESSPDDKAFFPASFVLKDCPEPRGNTPTESPDLPVEGMPESAPTPSVNGGDVCVALFAYPSDQEGDLTFEAGEVIKILKRESQWWTGQIGDRVGMFPFNYVEAVGNGQVADTAEVAAEAVTAEPEVAEQQVAAAAAPVAAPAAAAVSDQPEALAVAAAAPADNAAEPSKSDTVSRSKSKKKKKEDKKMELAKVMAPYEATSKEQLTLSRGQMVLIKKKTETGWWQGELQGDKGKKRQVGWFPATYVKLLSEGAAGGGDSKGASATDTAAATAEPAPATSNDLGAVASQPAAAAATATEEVPAAASSAAEDGQEKFRAVFDYGGQREDELSFATGDIITLVSREEEAWWKGELDGRVGVFPSNYVEAL